MQKCKTRRENLQFLGGLRDGEQGLLLVQGVGRHGRLLAVAHGQQDDVGEMPDGGQQLVVRGHVPAGVTGNMHRRRQQEGRLVSLGWGKIKQCN